MVKKKKKKANTKAEGNSRLVAMKRKNAVTFLLNDMEFNAIESYCNKYKIKNRSKFIRELLMRHVMDKFMDDYPSLFDKVDMERLKV